MENKNSPILTSSSSKNLKQNSGKINISVENQIRDLTPHAFLRSKSNALPPSVFESRDRWKKIKNIAEILELDGKDKRKNKNLHNTLGIWDNLIDKAAKDENIYYSQGLKKSEQKRLENSRSLRTLKPEIENEGSFYYSPSKKVEYDSRLKYSAVGSISNLLQKTPTYKQIYRQHAHKLQKQNIIFDYELKALPTRRERTPVNLNRLRNDISFAGLISSKQNKSFILERLPTMNYSRSKKLLSLSSDIFSLNNNQEPSITPTKIVPKLTDNKNILIKNNKSITYTVDIVDNTKKNMNLNFSKTRNQDMNTNLSTKINSKMNSKNQSKDTLMNYNYSTVKF